MKKQILKTCVAAALCLGGMSQALAVDVAPNGNNMLVVNSVVRAAACQFDQVSAVNFAMPASAFAQAAAPGALAGGVQDVTIRTSGCPLFSDAGNRAQLTITGVQVGPGNNFFQLASTAQGNAPIADHAVSLTLNGARVQSGTAIDLHGAQAGAVAADNTITLKAGLVKTANAGDAVQVADSTANLTVAIAYP
ncbi:hypothetical protein [Photorhabdus luminescens]|uniref:Fimbrial protein n=1 Tax=Photorhabdus luminescens subsp. mexicana TaxID=2100167 RepID=A0A4R4JGU2_PHOLU|nr:hypothetical protein [Photorhabdus luminescens]TDB52129.1 hypothetical protein C5468_10300 [Photorhabdus luminescens subsp. mexicana]